MSTTLLDRDCGFSFEVSPERFNYNLWSKKKVNVHFSRAAEVQVTTTELGLCDQNEMRKQINFTQLKRRKKTTDGSESISSKQQATISKFFTPLSKIKGKEDTFDAILQTDATKKSPLRNELASSAKCNEQNVHKRVKTTSDDESKSKRTKLSLNTFSKLNSFTVDSENELSNDLKNNKLVPKKHEKHRKEIDLAVCESEESECDEEYFKRKKKNSPEKCEFTPLEKQFMAIKDENKDAVLFIECGYKYRLFGDDAEIAAKELNILCHLDHNFQTASIPSHRFFVHVRRLVAKGYKVGVVKQTETAALKAAGDNKGGPFTRKLSALYTKSTIIGEDVDIKSEEELCELSVGNNDETSYLVCLCESDNSKGDVTTVGMVAVRPTTGELMYDEFIENSVRQKLANRFAHLQPSEVLIPTSQLSVPTLKLIENFTHGETLEDRMRIEKLPDESFEYMSAVATLTHFFEGKDDNADSCMQSILGLPCNVIRCLAAVVEYLRPFGLDGILSLAGKSMVKYSGESKHMSLNATTVRNLELFRNLTDGKMHGSLLWYLNHTQTPFGWRLMKKWISRPLQSIREIEKRQDVVAEIIESKSPVFKEVKQIIYKLPDLEKQLGSAFHNKCRTATFYSMLKTFCQITSKLQLLKSQIECDIQVESLKTLLLDILDTLNDLPNELIKNLNEKAARDGDKTKVFKDDSSFPDVVDCRLRMHGVLQELKSLRASICKVLRIPGFDYTTVSGLEFLIEVKNAQLKAVPQDWIKISSTKQVVRFRSQEVDDLVRQLSQLREELVLVSAKAWNSYIQEFNEHFSKFSRAVKNLARLDCFLSLAVIAKQADHCRPLLVEHSNVLHIEGGRHPVISVLMPEGSQYVANDTLLDAEKRCMIITGPNMGGKSSYIRQVALIVLMTHMGSYVPATAVTMSIIDGIFTRMGAYDQLFQHRSTFLIELQEAAQAMTQATSKSLIILDELGRGTSTHDGTAIAHATLDFFVNNMKGFTLFVTHYTALTEMERLKPLNVRNFYMSFLADSADDSRHDFVAFLFQLTEGIAAESFGLNVAKLADLPCSVVDRAKCQAKRMKEEFRSRRDTSISFCQLWKATPNELHGRSKLF